MSLASPVVIADQYEALRAAVLARSAGGHRYGLALLLREGMAPWISAWAGCVKPPVSDQSASPASSPSTTEPTPWIQLLASMALSILQEAPS